MKGRNNNMNSLVFRLVIMILTMTLSKIIYIKIDEKHDLTNKVCNKLHIEQEWIGFCSVICLVIYLLMVEVLGIEIIEIPKILYYILGGIFAGVCNGTNNKGISNKQ